MKEPSNWLLAFLISKVVLRVAFSVASIVIAATIVEKNATSELVWCSTFGGLNLLFVIGKFIFGFWSEHETYNDPHPITIAIMSFLQRCYVKADIVVMIALAIWGFIVAALIQNQQQPTFPFLLAASIFESMFVSHTLYHYFTFIRNKDNNNSNTL
jgi:hypothetical protein